MPSMRIAIINTIPVPSGNASVNRFLGYGKGLVRNAASVHVLSSASFDDSMIDGIQIISCGRDTSMFGALRNILSHIRKDAYDAVIIVSNSLLLIYPVWLVCKFHHVKLLQEKSEFPFVLMETGFIHGLFAKLYVGTTYRLFDGLIVMTRALMDFFRDKVKKTASLFEMPMTVDTERFAIQKQASEYGDYIAYCGNMAGNKDGVLNLIESFNLASPSLRDVKLLLIGRSTCQEDGDAISEAIAKTNNPRIILYGEASRDKIPSLLKNAKALALARPSSLQSQGGFPTKLGEYLATGNPVIVTAVGDIPQYLNASNSFLVPADNNQLFANALIQVFADYDHAMAIGEKGRELAVTTFSSEYQSKRLFEYLKSVCG